jgi:hypothetical protein
MHSRRRSDSSFESGGEIVKLKRHADCLPREVLYNLNAKLIVDSGLDDEVGVFWYLDKNKTTIDRRLRDLLKIVKTKGTKLMKASSIEAERFKAKLKIAGALINLTRSRSIRNNRPTDSWISPLSMAINSRLDESTAKDDEDMM